MTDEEFLKVNHYQLKYTEAVGYWVDGCCGYMVAGYSSDKGLIAAMARDLITMAAKTGGRQIWRFTNFRLMEY